jgi:hypothetical protein
MFSQRKFTPGNNSNAKRIINYNAVYDMLNPNSFNEYMNNINNNNNNCTRCEPVITNKNVPLTDSPSARLPYNVRVSQLVNISKGGSTHYGNFYLGQPLQLNYLGRAEGMPGGSGRPPRNQFN